jgi:hypothetical protein
MSIVFYLKTDGQTKIVNQKTKLFFKRILTINKITRITSSLKQKL